MRSDFTFAKDDALTFLPWHMGAMVALATFLLALVVSLSSWVGHHEADYKSSFSVILPGTLESLDDKTKQVTTLLGKNADIVKVSQVSEDQLRTLLAPWIGNGDALTDTALPVVLDVALKKNADAQSVASKLQPALEAVAPTIELDVKNSWAALFSSFVSILQWLAAALVAVIIAAMTMVIIFSARASLHAHKRTVSILHAIGAEDGYIATQFQREHFKMGLKGAALGAIIAALAYLLLGVCVASLQSPMLPGFSFEIAHYALILLMPPICACIVLMTTRLSVLAQLRQVL